MKHTVTMILLSAAVAFGASAQNGSKQVTLEEITSGAFSQKTSVNEMRSLPDGEFYSAMSADKSAIVRYSYRTGAAVDTLFNAKKARECTFKDFDGYTISSTGHHILVWRKTQSIYRRSKDMIVYDFDVRRNYVKPLVDETTRLMIPTFSPDGRMCAYVRDNNIWIKKFDYDTEVQVTKDGEANKILNGITDWVYEEEFSVTNMLAWSPDSQVLAFLRFDESGIPDFKLPIFGSGLYPSEYTYKYPLAGQKNSEISLRTYNVESKDTKTMKLPLDDIEYIPRIVFTTQADQLAVMTLNRNQNRFNMYYVNPKSGVFRLILKEENEKYVDSDWFTSIQFSTTGFTYVSERDGYAHLYLFSPTGVMQRQVTKGNWDVTRFIGLDPLTGAAYYESAEESPMRRAVYKIDVKGVKTKLSSEVGTNSAEFSANYAYFVNRFENMKIPSRITVNETKTGKVLRVLEDNQALTAKLKEYAFPQREFTTVHTEAAGDLNAWMLKPLDFDANKKYPVVMIQYSGPNSQQVLDTYSFGWENYLTQHGIIVVSVDGRGTGARGEAFRKCTYEQMGVFESQDQADAARALGNLSYIDGKRIAIWGWSFGGYNTLMALSTGKGAFKCGIAVAPPTDWKYYDSVYTERFMRTPQENFKGYEATSLLLKVNDLQGKLLLVHGTADDNVHFMQTMEYAEALVQAGKQFQMQVYKDRNHSIFGGNTRLHLYTRMSEYLFDNL